jgi:hypothetical protein
MLKVTQHFSSCHFQDEYVLVGHFQKLYIGKAVGGELDVMVQIIGGATKRAIIQLEMSTWLRKRGVEKIFKGHVVRKRGDERSLVTM